jgi:hypothetical protein
MHRLPTRRIARQSRVSFFRVHVASTALQPIVHTFSTGLRALLTAVVVCGVGAPAALGQTPAATPAVSTDPSILFRVFLKDGTSIASIGELARVGDRVVFALPLSATRQPAASLAAGQVDFERTERYANAVRATRYAATRGEADFAAMSGLVARTLSDIAVTPGRAAQLALAERARRTLANWPRDHYGYRADDVRQTLALLDEVVAGLRAAAGETRFDVNLVAATLPPPPTETPLGPPTLQEAIEQALRLSTLAGSAAERVLLLEHTQAVLVESSAVPAADAVRAPEATWVAGARRRAASALDLERQTDKAYRDLAVTVMRNVDRRAARSDVRGLLRVRAGVVERDRSLGSKRPEEIQALLSTIDDRLDAARRLRLAQDQWTVRAPVLRAYREAVKPTLERLRSARVLLSDIRTLAGPALTSLSTFLRQLDALTPFVRALSVPDEARDAHAALQSALQLAGTAARTRQRAIVDADMRAAWDASAAAAGALLFCDRAEALAAVLLHSPASMAGRGAAAPVAGAPAAATHQPR